MGLFDIFKKKKEEVKPVEPAQTAATPKATVPAETPVVDNALPPVPETNFGDSTFSSGMDTNNQPVENPTETPVQTEVENISNDNVFTSTPTNLSTQNMFSETPVDTMPAVDQNIEIPKEENPIEPAPIENMNTNENSLNVTIDYTNPVEVENISTEEEKSKSVDIKPAIEDVAALIDNPIPAKSEEENMAVNLEMVMSGGDNYNPFETQEMPTLETPPAVIDNPPVEEDITSTSEPIAIKEEEIELPKENNSNDNVIDLSSNIEENNIDFPDDFNPTVDDFKSPESSELATDISNEEPKLENQKIEEDSNIFNFDDKVEEPTTNELPTLEESTNIDIPEEQPEIELPKEEPINMEVPEEQPEIELPKEEPINMEVPEEQPEIELPKEESVNMEVPEEQPVLTEEKTSSIFDEVETKEDNDKRIVITEPVEELSPLEIIDDEELPEPKKEEVEEYIEEEPYDGPYLVDETEFTIFDLPPLAKEHKEEVNKYNSIIDEIEKEITKPEEVVEKTIEEETKEEIIPEEEIHEEEISKEDISEDDEVQDFSYLYEPIKVEEEPSDIFVSNEEEKKEEPIDFNDIYNKVEFKNEKVRFCDNCGAMIVDESINICPSCGETL